MLTTAARFSRVAVVLLPACGGGGREPPPDLPAVGGQVTLLRFPRGGGIVEAHHPDSLGRVSWTSESAVPPLARVLGANLDDRLAWAVDAKHNLVAVDLESRLTRVQFPGVSQAGMGPDGSLYLTDGDQRVMHFVRRTPVAFHEPLPAAPRALFGTLNDQLVAVTGGARPHLITANAEQGLTTVDLPDGPVAATYWGDLVAVATDSGVVLFETQGRRNVTTLKTKHGVRETSFSPSGHRLYLLADDDGILVYDRFRLSEIARIKLPGFPASMRVDASGRWMLARPATADSVWVVDLATNRLAGEAPGEWGPDLPLVAGASTLVVRLGSDVVTYDLRSVPPARLGQLAGAARDFWLATSWVPRERLPAAAAAAESATVAQDSALVSDSTASQADSTDIYLQVSLSQNADRAAGLANQIKQDGFPATVLKPAEAEEGYRVVVGPYATRDSAEAVGKKLGRSYFIIRRPPRRP